MKTNADLIVPPCGKAFLGGSDSSEKSTVRDARKAAPFSPSRHAFSLIEMIGVLAVIALLAAILIPSFIRKLDQIAGDKEMASLKALGDAFQSSILRNRYIPSTNNWAQTIATERGVNVNDVLNNLRRQPRMFLVDPALEIGVRRAGEDYRQDFAGSTNRPVNPRFILLSSIGEPLPAGIFSGVAPSTNAFNAIWNSVDGQLPAGSPWTGWRGAEDLKIHRVNLSGLFVHVVLTSYASTNPADGYYSIDGGPLAATVGTYGRDTHFLQNSILDLYKRDDTNSLDTRQILTRDISFVYQQNVWRASIEGLGFAGGMDIGTIVDRFLRAPHNPNALTPDFQQVYIVQAMLDYMRAYRNWEATGFTDNGLLATAQDLQEAMMDRVQELYKYGGGPGGTNYAPTPIPCPP